MGFFCEFSVKNKPASYGSFVLGVYDTLSVYLCVYVCLSACRIAVQHQRDRSQQGDGAR